MSDTKIRILLCYVCGESMRLPWFEGSGYDAVLDDACQRHQHGLPLEGTRGRLFVMTEDEYDLLKRSEQRPDTVRGFDTRALLDAKDQYTEDAGRCFNDHGRPSQGCIDWHAKGKGLGRHVGVPADERRYVCDFCPVASWVEQQQNAAAGLYR